jgi:hypothetical protein
VGLLCVLQRRNDHYGRSKRGGKEGSPNEKAPGGWQESGKDSEIESGWQEGCENAKAEGSRQESSTHQKAESGWQEGSSY